MKKNIMVTLLVILCLVINFPAISFAEESTPTIFGDYGAAIDANSGELLYEKNANEKAYPASMTKVMTAILLDENVPDNKLITVSENAATQECSCFGFTPGEKISKEDAMKAMLVKSANDLAVAIAEHISGSTEEFSKLMNKKVKELGLKNTHFVTPNGLHDEQHYTSAYDMALIVKEALKHPKVIEAMGIKKITIKTDKQEKELVNHTQIFENPDAIAGKTGYTSMAQNTLAVVLKRGQKEIIAVTMKSSKEAEYTDISTMANYGFEQIQTKELVKKGEVIETKTIHGKEVNGYIKNNYKVSYLKNKKTKYTKEIQNIYDEKGKIEEGDVIGHLIIKKDGEQIAKLDILSDRHVEKPTQKSYKNAIIAILIPMPVYLILLIQMKRKREEKMELKTE